MLSTNWDEVCERCKATIISYNQMVLFCGDIRRRLRLSKQQQSAATADTSTKLALPVDYVVLMKLLRLCRGCNGKALKNCRERAKPELELRSLH